VHAKFSINNGHLLGLCQFPSVIYAKSKILLFCEEKSGNNELLRVVKNSNQKILMTQELLIAIGKQHEINLKN